MEADEAMRDALDAGSTPGEGSTAHRKEGWRRHRAESTQIVLPSTDDAKAEGKVPRCAARAGTGSDLASAGYCGDQQGRVSAGARPRGTATTELEPNGERTRTHDLIKCEEPVGEKHSKRSTNAGPPGTVGCAGLIRV
jgi:hypothetical protein